MFSKSISKLKQIRDYIQYNTGKFTVRNVSEGTGIEKRYISRYLQELQKDGVIRLVCMDGSRGIYVKVVHKYALTSEMESEIVRLGKTMTRSEVCDKLNMPSGKLGYHIQAMKRRGIYPQFKRNHTQQMADSEMYIQRVDSGREYSLDELCDAAKIDNRRGIVANMVRCGLLERIRRSRKVYFRKVG